MSLSTIGILAISLLGTPPDDAPKFERIVIDNEFPGGYQVEVADVNGDRKPDIIALGGNTCAWYENPSWKKRIITTGDQTPGIISSATADIDGDGKAEVAIAYEFEMNKPRQGKLLMAVQGASVEDPWTLKPIADVPSIHRLRWGTLDGGKSRTLIIAPLFGPDATPPRYADPAHLRLYRPGEGTNRLETVSPDTIDPRSPAPDIARPSPDAGGYLVMHAIDVIASNDGAADVILTASNRGVVRCNMVAMIKGDHVWLEQALVTGAHGDAPKKGSSEVHLGNLKDGRKLLATIEPWHGNQVVVYPSRGQRLQFEERLVIDDTLDDGHALWLADINNDGTDEVFAGHRGKDHRVSVYKLDGATWKKTVIDRDIAAQDLRGGDLDGDGIPEVVSIGGATHNVIIYRYRP